MSKNLVLLLDKFIIITFHVVFTLVTMEILRSICETAFSHCCRSYFESNYPKKKTIYSGKKNYMTIAWFSF